MPRRHTFRRGDEFVAVKILRLASTTTMEPGTRLDKSKFRLHHLRSLYDRRRIGKVGDPWTEEQLASWRALKAPEPPAPPSPPPQPPKPRKRRKRK